MNINKYKLQIYLTFVQLSQLKDCKILMASRKFWNERYVLSIGQICADLITICDCYPEEDLQVCAEEQYWQRGGNAGNFAEVLSNLGTKVEFMGTFPDMEKMKQSIMGGVAEARYCLAELDRAKVTYGHLALRDCQNFPSTSSLLSKATGTRTIAHYRGPLDELTIEDFEALDLNDYCWMHFEGRKNFDVIKKQIEIVQKHNNENDENKVMVSAELELPEFPRLADIIPLADMIIVSRYFARHLGFQSALECVSQLCDQLKQGSDVVCSWGHLGAAYATNAPGDNEGLIPAVKPDAVVDTLGAGDTFQASLIHAKLNGLNLAESVKFACKVASKKISSIGYNGVIGMGLKSAKGDV